jgi:3-oxoacyl-[acyl-carrier protein] reductase
MKETTRTTAPRKVALVTGSATGAGRAIAVRFAAQGLAVAVNYSRSEAEAKETLAEIQKHGVPAILCRANVADDGAVRAMFQRVRDELGGLDVLVNNAGTTRFIDRGDLEAVTEQVWEGICTR